jgi:hypothetical protein
MERLLGAKARTRLFAPCNEDSASNYLHRDSNRLWKMMSSTTPGCLS